MRAVLDHRRRARLLLGRRPEGHQRRRDTRRDGRPDVYKTLTERYHPIMHDDPRDAQAGASPRVNGPAVGIGCSLALCCDLIVAAESAYFLLAFVNIGLVPDGGSSLFVPTRVGMARATELSMLGERLPAPQALEWGLINRVVPDDAAARRRPRRSPRAWRPGRRAPTPAPSASSTTGCTRGWTSSSSSRRRSSRRWPAATTSSRARWPSSQKRPPRFCGS